MKQIIHNTLDSPVRPYILLGVILTFFITGGLFFLYSSANNVVTSSVFYPFAQSETSRQISAILFSPQISPSEEPAAALIFHGISAHKEWVHNYGFSLASNGIYSLCVDLRLWGWSQDLPKSQYLLQVAIRSMHYLMNSTQVNFNRLAVVGHSLGMGVALMLAKTYPNIQATVLLGNEFASDALFNVPTAEYWPLNLTSPRNLLYGISPNDEFISYPNAINYFASAVNCSAEDVIPFNTYNGNFSGGLARRLVVTESNHLFQLIDHTLISETTDWILNAFEMHKTVQISYELREIILFVNAITLNAVFVYLFFIIFHEIYLKSKKPGEKSLQTSGYAILSRLIGLVLLGLVLALLPILRSFRLNPLIFLQEMLDFRLENLLILSIFLFLSTSVILALEKKDIDLSIHSSDLVVINLLAFSFLPVFYLLLFLGMIGFFSYYIYVLALFAISLLVICSNILTLRFSHHKTALIVQILIFGIFLAWIVNLWVVWVI